MGEEKPKYEIEFDEKGQIRIKDPKLARLILEHVAIYNGLQIQVDVVPKPLENKGCTPPPVLPPNLPTGCTNTLCPMSLRLSFPEAGVPERWASLEEGMR